MNPELKAGLDSQGPREQLEREVHQAHLEKGEPLDLQGSQVTFCILVLGSVTIYVSKSK